jgi:hypothetical protein
VSEGSNSEARRKFRTLTAIMLLPEVSAEQSHLVLPASPLGRDMAFQAMRKIRNWGELLLANT